MKSDKLMRLLVPDGRVKETAAALSMSESQVYQERRPCGDGYGQTGKRNIIARLDIIAELALSESPEAVRMLGQRYFDLYARSVAFGVPTDEDADILPVLAQTYLEIGQAMSLMTAGEDVDLCEAETEQAIFWMQRCVRILKAKKGQKGGAK